MTRLVLASGSPRRRELLDRLGVAFEVVVPDVDESRHPGEPPDGYVRRVAAEKALAINEPDAVVIAADTAVVLGDEVLGKPAGPEDAVRMLASLAGRSHLVMTGVAVVHPDGEVMTHVDITTVTMAALSDVEIARYVASGEALDKAGAYAFQGVAGVFIERIDGDPWNVMGLPLPTTYRLLTDFGVLD